MGQKEESFKDNLYELEEEGRDRSGDEKKKQLFFYLDSGY